MIRYPITEPVFGPEELRNVTACVKSGWISSQGPFVRQFEEEMAAACRVNHAVAVANGTVSLHLALAALGIGPGDEVVVPALTFVATANVVRYTGATPVLADVDPGTWNITAATIDPVLTRRTRAVIPVHLYGHPCDMRPIAALARARRLWIVEDAAEAHGADYHGRPAGSLGDIGSFSFFANKTLTTGEGGMCLTDSRRLADRMRFLKDHAMSRTRKYYHPEVGFNYRMTALQAAIGVAQLHRLPHIVQRKRRLADWYKAELADIPGIVPPPERAGIRNSYWMYSVVVGPQFGRSRDWLASHLREQGIDTRPFFHALHQMPPYRTRKRYPVSERLSAQGLSLPSSPKLARKDVTTIAGVIRAAQRAGSPMARGR